MVLSSSSADGRDAAQRACAAEACALEHCLQQHGYNDAARPCIVRRASWEACVAAARAARAARGDEPPARPSPARPSLPAVPPASPARTLAMTLALGLVTRLALASSVVRVPTLPYEAHSQNDIDAWPSLLAVGTRFLKLDIGVCDRASCEAFSTFGRSDLPGPRGNASDCFDAAGATYCCLCMRGDASTRPTLHDPFNTTWDFLLFLAAAPPGVPRLPLAPGDVPLRLGLDFGGSPGCGQLTSPPCAANALISAWLLGMRDAIAQNGLAVEPYGDAGIGGLMSGLDAACGPKGDPASCTPTQRELQALPWPNEGGGRWNASDARLAVFNDDWTTLLQECSQAGIFDVADEKSETGFLWYEQQDEYEFKNLFDEWATCAARPPRRSSNNTGIVAVSNSAPAQFELFASTRIGRGLKAQFTDATFSAPLLAVAAQAAGGNGSGADRWAVLGTRRASPAPAATLLYALPLVDGAAPAALDAAASVLQLGVSAPLVALAFAVGAAPTDGTAQLLAATAIGEASLISLDLATGALAVLASGKLSPSLLPQGFAVLSAALCATDDVNPGDVFAVFLVADTAGAAVNVSFVTVANLSAPLNPSHTAALQLPGRGRAATGGGALTLANSAAEGGGPFAGVAVWASASALGQGELFGASVVAEFYDSDGVFVVARDGLAQGTAPRRIGFGARPHLSSLEAAPGTPWASSGALVQLLATDSDCDGGLLLNNANFARCQLSNPALDVSPFYAPFQSCAALTTYSLGPLASWDALVSFSPAPAAPWDVESALGVCHPAIAHGKVGVASASIAGALYLWSAAHPNGTRDARGDESFGAPCVELATLAVADGHVVDSLPVLALCGLPNLADGLSWAQWRTPQAPLH
jgi:hypothetical protein